LIGAIVLAIVWMTGVPLDVLGLSRSPDLFGGILLGVGVFALVEGMTLVAKHVGVAEPERLRRMLAPETRREWLLLLGLVLPAVAVSEELLFRGALIGGLAAGTSFSPWFFVVLSALAFGVSHTAQGWMGIGVTGALGFLLGACFVLTGDLLLLVVAHYLVDTFEFLLHEGIDLQWGQSL
jgi:membrane protease YdiL (CAAX protease family)